MIWKDIPEYEGSYQVSDTGVVKSLDRFNCVGRRVYGKMIQPSGKKGGFKHVAISKDGITKTIMVHRLVAQTFLLMNGRKPDVKHKDGDRANNNASNLEWCDYEEISRSAFYDFNRKLSGIAKERKPVMMMSMGGRDVKSFITIAKAVEYLRGRGFPKALTTPISACCYGVQKSAYHKKWRFFIENEGEE